MRGVGVARTAVVLVAGAAMVWGAGRTDARLDLSRPDDIRVAAPSDTRSLTRSEVVCPGPDRPGSPGTGAAAQDVQLITAGLPQEMLPDHPTGAGGMITARTLPGSGALLAVDRRGDVATGTVSGPSGVDIVGSGALAPGLTALQVDDDRAPATHGLAMTTCTRTASTSYLIAGGPEPGRLERVVLTNPSPNPVVARVSVLGTTHTQDVTVAGRSRAVTLLGAVDDTAQAPVVKVTSASGTLAVALSDLFQDGTRPVGSEVTGPARPPAQSSLIPAVLTGAGPVSVRIGVPGAEDAVVRVQVVGPSEDPVPDAVRTVAAGSSGTITLPDLPAQRYALRITSDVPVVAAAESVSGRGTGGATDIAWMPTSEPITAVGGTPVPRVPGASAALVLSAEEDAEQVVTVGLTDTSGTTTPQRVRIPAGGVANVPTGSATAVWVRTTARPVHAALVVSGSERGRPMLSAVPVSPVAVAAKVMDSREGLPQ
ncbi:DUF5719 family protein [Luteipulveratus sp. YIM 133132]|uniref:DUF5719 family protein n=1 Tax=Luteipulveratus flavus TaxID=3031728 RepID=UPI0023AF040E|nr:DUF5719 family protein [Luteipulveratus sp. YIM 133132]MDE9367708.1 DUF5719 family protein [Luteipulveratus sp. YIM 133132]